MRSKFYPLMKRIAAILLLALAVSPVLAQGTVQVHFEGTAVDDRDGDISNSIVWGNWGFFKQVSEVASADIRYCCLQDQTTYYNDWSNRDADPEFTDPANHDLRLPRTSWCVDWGQNSAVPAGVPYDRDMNRRIMRWRWSGPLRVDLGPYELSGFRITSQYTATYYNENVGRIGSGLP